MNFSLQPFQNREAYQLDYSVPPDDLLSALPQLPVAPVMVSVDDGTLTFKTVPGATSYILYKREAGPVFGQIFEAAAEPGAEMTVANGSITRPAFYRVTAVNNEVGEGPPSNALFLDLVIEPPVATDADDIGTNSFSANWTAASGAISYRLDVSLDPDFTMLVLDNVDVGSGLGYLVPDLNPGVTYFYRVRSMTAYGPSVNSNVIETATISLCTDFGSHFSWTTPTIIQTGVATATVDVLTEGSIDISCSAGPASGTNQGAAHNILGTQTYTGPDLTCHVNWAPNITDGTGLVIDYTMRRNGALVIDLDETDPPGIYEFTIAAGTSLAITLDVNVTVTVLSAPSVTSACHLIAEIGD